MLAHVKLVLLCAVLLGIMMFDVAVAARQLLDDYDNCHNGWCAAVRTVLQVVLGPGWCIAQHAHAIVLRTNRRWHSQGGATVLLLHLPLPESSTCWLRACMLAITQGMVHERIPAHRRDNWRRGGYRGEHLLFLTADCLYICQGPCELPCVAMWLHACMLSVLSASLLGPAQAAITTAMGGVGIGTADIIGGGCPWHSAACRRLQRRRFMLCPSRVNLLSFAASVSASNTFLSAACT